MPVYDVDSRPELDADADAYIRRVRCRLFPTNAERDVNDAWTADSEVGRQRLELRREVDSLVARMRGRGSAPTAIATAVVRHLAENGLDENAVVRTRTTDV